MTHTIPKWAKSALVDGQMYRRLLVPDSWIPEQHGPPSLTQEQVANAKRVSFFADNGREK